MVIDILVALILFGVIKLLVGLAIEILMIRLKYSVKRKT